MGQTFRKIGLFAKEEPKENEFLQRLSIDTIAEIFQYLSVADLKNCRQVCSGFTNLVDGTKILYRKSINVYDGLSKMDDRLLSFLKSGSSREHLYGTNLRLQNFYESAAIALVSRSFVSIDEAAMNWLTKEKVGHWICDLELYNCHITPSAFEFLMSNLINLFRLVVKYTNNEYQGLTLPVHHIQEFMLTEESAVLAHKLKQVILHAEQAVVPPTLVTYKGIKSWLLQHCNNLEVLVVEDLFQEFDPIGVLKENDMLTISGALQKNQKTLRRLKLATFCPHVMQSKKMCLKPANLVDLQRTFDKPYRRHERSFYPFIQMMSERDWLSFGLQLTHLDLSFYLVVLNSGRYHLRDQINPRHELLEEDPHVNVLVPALPNQDDRPNSDLIQTTLFPFLRQQRHLQQFKFGRLYTTGFNSTHVQTDFLHQLKQCFRSHCELDIQILDSIAVEGINSLTTDQFIAFFNEEYLQVSIRLMEEGYLPQFGSTRPIDGPIRFDSTDIINQSDSTIQLVSSEPRSRWNFFYVGWSTLNGTLLERILPTMTKILIQQSGVDQSQTLKITDDNLQEIIRRGRNVTHLCIEYCDLSQVTDFGLTGITAEASARMLDSKQFSLEEDDLVGRPLADLPCLSVLKLSILGPRVTDVSAHLGFKGMKISDFKLMTPNFSEEGELILRNSFANDCIETLMVQLY